MKLETINILIEGLEGERSIKEDKYYEALCLLRDAMMHPNFTNLIIAQSRAILSGKEFMSIDAEGIVTNLDRKSITLLINPCDHVFTINESREHCFYCGAKL